MTAIQDQERGMFGVGRLYANDPAGNRFVYATMNDVEVDFKVDLKEYYSENAFAVGVASGHVSVDITAKHYHLALAPIATDLGAAAPVASVSAAAVDETGLIATSSYTLVNAATLVPNTLIVQVILTSAGGVNYLWTYNKVGATPVAGVSYTIAAGVLTFAAGDTGRTVVVNYEYTNVTGSLIQLNNVVQNSNPFYKLTLIKRDTSPIDGSVGYFIAKFNSVKAGGLKTPFKEGSWSEFDRSFKAFADPANIVATFQFVNI
jgi:hypothetical protein